MENRIGLLCRHAVDLLKISVVCIALLAAQAVHAADQTFRVDGIGGSTTGDGSDWGEDAFLYLQDALAAAAAWVTVPNQNNTAQIWVRGATGDGIKYRPDQSAANEGGSNDREATFALVPNVRLYGGFLNTHTSLGERVPSAYRTILTGNLGNPTWTADNSWHVVTASNASSTRANTLIDGFEICDGQTGEDEIASGCGGGVLCINGASPRFDRCVIRNNIAFYGPDLHIGGGGAAVLGSGTAPAFVRCSFLNNLVIDWSIDSSGGGLFISEAGDVDVVNSVFIGNICQAHQYAYGGGIAVESAILRIVNSIIAENEANAGGASFPFAFGGGLYASAAVVQMINCTVAANAGVVGQLGIARGGGYYQTSDPKSGSNTFTNCILWENVADGGGAAIYRDGGPSLTISYTDILTSEVSGTVSWGSGNIEVDPQFTGPSLGSGYLLSYTSPCLNSGDPAALPADTFDLNGDSDTNETIPFDGVGLARQVNPPTCVDIGAAENQTPGTTDCPADITGNSIIPAPDGEVNVSDLLAVLNAWGTTSGIVDFKPSPCGDDIVNASELLEVINNWGVCGGVSGGAPTSIEDCYDVCYAAWPDHEGKFSECLAECIDYLCQQELIECD